MNTITRGITEYLSDMGTYLKIIVDFEQCSTIFFLRNNWFRRLNYEISLPEMCFVERWVSITRVVLFNQFLDIPLKFTRAQMILLQFKSALSRIF